MINTEVHWKCTALFIWGIEVHMSGGWVLKNFFFVSHSKCKSHYHLNFGISSSL